MANLLHQTRKCPRCGQEYPLDVQVCTECRVILLTPGQKPATPGWVIAGLVILILILGSYAAWLAWRVLVNHDVG